MYIPCSKIEVSYKYYDLEEETKIFILCVKKLYNCHIYWNCTF